MTSTGSTIRDEPPITVPAGPAGGRGGRHHRQRRAGAPGLLPLPTSLGDRRSPRTAASRTSGRSSMDGEPSRPTPLQQVASPPRSAPCGHLPSVCGPCSPHVAAASRPLGALDRLAHAPCPCSVLACDWMARCGTSPGRTATRATCCAWRQPPPRWSPPCGACQAGLEPVAPDPSLDHAANYLWMLTGRRPEPAGVRALEQYLILTVDHGFNNSTFAARVIASSGADAAAAVTGGDRRPLRAAARQRAEPGPRHARRHRVTRPGARRGCAARHRPR